jgi:photosynthetic reaction center cytochrome c subunit
MELTVTKCPSAPQMWLSAAACILFAGLAAPAGAQPPAAGQAKPATSAGPTSAEKYMNIKVLKDLPAAQLHDVMVYMEAALGTNCEGCHVRGTDGQMAFDKDDKRNKQTARKMIEMVTTINVRDFNGEQQVNCTTCHQGRLGPNAIPQLAQPATSGQPAAPPPAPPGTRPKPPAETPEQVVSKFVDALGGRDALARVSSRTRKGTITNRAGQASPIVIDEKAPGRYLASIASTPPATQGVSGADAWVRSGERLRERSGVEALVLASAADLSLPLDLPSRYAGLAARAYDVIDGRNVIVMMGRPSPDITETLSFDRETGLLLRRVVRFRTSMGRLPQQIDYADYRVVDGVKVPFEVRIADWSSISVMKFTDITLNPKLDDAKFVKPEVK